jgi:hypothetical protein
VIKIKQGNQMPKKIWLRILICFLILIFTPVLIDSFLRLRAGDPVDAKKKYWEQTIATEIPVGSTKKEVFRWAKNRGIGFDNLPGNKLYSNIEHIPELGLIKFPCTFWNIIITVYFG